MKARFNIRFPLNGRHTPAQDGAPTAPRCHIRTDRPSSQQVPIPDEVMTSSGIGSELNLKLEDEVPTPEIEAYTRYLVLLSSNEQENPELSLIDILPSYVRLKNDYADACEARKEHQYLVKQLVKAAEPLLSNGTVAEQEKQGLLNVTGLAVEKVMQLKLRTVTIHQRLDFLKHIIPQYAHNYARLLGHSGEFCQQVEQRAKAALSRK